MYCNNLQAQGLKINGTWVNTEIYNAVHEDMTKGDLDLVVPRCIYIDLNYKMTVEFRFEQKSKTSAISKISKKGDSTFFSSMERNFAIANDSVMLLLNRHHRSTFKKINDKSVIGNGIQALLRGYFWGKNKKWKVITFNDGKSTDTTMADIEGSKIYSQAGKEIFGNYEFTDVKRYNIDGQLFFGIVFFDVNSKHMTDSVDVFHIRKSGSIVYLCKGDRLSYTFSPID
jgi:hypothetical protein